MKDKTKTPAWLQDRKKLIIIGLIILAMIATTVNTFAVTSFLAGRFIGKDGIKLSAGKRIEDFFSSKALDGTYENPYANETITFMKNGNMVYTFEDEIDFGTYKMKGDILTLNLDGYDYEFTLEENTGKTLVFSDGYYQYYYEKQ